MRSDAADELTRARLAFVSVGKPALTAPRRAQDEPEPEPVDEPAPSHAVGWSRAQLAAIGVVILVVVILVGASMIRSSPQAIPAVPVVESPQPVVDAAASPAPSASPALPAKVRVHVLGGVMQPGVVSVSADAIVADAVEAAGGFAADAQPGDLNLAAPVGAGMQVKVGTAGEASRVDGAGSSGAAGGGGSGAAEGKLNLNSASAGELESLPGIGPVTAAAIVAWRDEHGGFTTVSELQEISGIGPKTFAKLESLVDV